MIDPSSMRLAITGANGFVASHVLTLLAALDPAPSAILGIDCGQIKPPIGMETRVQIDITDRAALRSWLETFRPTAVLHLAGVAQGTNLEAYFQGNIWSAQNLFATCADLDTKPRLVLVGSAAQYGVPLIEDVPLQEDHPLTGMSPYGLSKTFQERWGTHYFAAHQLPLVFTRPFNLLGPGQSPSLVPAGFMAQIKDYLDGRTTVVRVGNLMHYRDFVDVRDFAGALWGLLTAGDDVNGQVFNVASGQATSIQFLLNACIELAGQSIPVETAEDRLRPLDVSRITGDASKIRQAIGWEPRISLEASLLDMWKQIQSPLSNLS